MKKPLNWHIKSFDELNIQELYSILRLRSEVFVVEQDCVYQDIDNKDQKARHVFGSKDGQICAYARIFDSGDYFDEASIGRIVVAEEERAHGYGHELVLQAIRAVEHYYKTKIIKISAQTYLLQFYKQHGFEAIGAEYLEDGIPHMAMLRK